jgi:hypothetical protein
LAQAELVLQAQALPEMLGVRLLLDLLFQLMGAALDIMVLVLMAAAAAAGVDTTVLQF